MNRVTIPPEWARLAADYHREHRGLALLIRLNGETLLEDHAPGHPAGQPLPIASGTKSFVGILASTAASDGLLHLDEPLVTTLPEWRDDPRQSRITVRQLLQLVGGLACPAKAGRAPGFEAALKTPAVSEPGSRFFYGSAPFQVFGEFLRRKLSALCPDPLDYLCGRILDRIGLPVGRWRRGDDGWPDFSAGASLTAQSWARLGELVRLRGRWDGQEVIAADALDECFRGSAENPAYGLGWWLNRPLADSARSYLRHATLGLEDLAGDARVPADLVYAAGAGKQRLYVSRRLNLVIVRQAAGVLEALAGGEHSRFSDREFFRRLLAPDSPPPAATS